MKVKSADGQTPLTAEDLEGLIPNLTTQEELNQYEAANIMQGRIWAKKSRIIKKDFLTASALLRLHKEMYGDVWAWAGSFRKSLTVPGVATEKIQNELGKLLGDVRFWLKHKTFSVEEIAIRFHHRLVWIHPFPNGNGRFSRLACEILLEQNNHPAFTWSGANIVGHTEARKTYISALKKMDANSDDFHDLLKFAKQS